MNTLESLLLCAGLISANFDSFGAAREVPSPAWVMMVANRGDHAAAHENSLEAI